MRLSTAATALLLVAAGCRTQATAPAAEANATAARRSHSTGGRSGDDSGGEAATAEGSPARAAQRRYEEGAAAAQRRDWAAAAQAFTEAYALVPSTELAFNAGRMYEHLADSEHAAEWYRRVLAGSPHSAVRAQVNERLAAVERDALRRRESNAQAPPDNAALSAEASTWFERGMRFFRRRQWAEALQAFETANQLLQAAGGDIAELMFNLGVTHEHLGHSSEAEAAFRSYLSARPDSPARADIEQRIQRLRQER